ncbi:hypothetical protein YC2023_042260 [Brassica napus]|uniref:(rape) hypothetical protein n=1 Tax=Brassica napus TaxID=3708 RepID=A0A816IIL4_BRANA|nr:unnamed protein product [Brassica napus]
MKSRRRPYLTPLTSPSQPPSISTSPPQVAIKIACEVLYFSGMASSTDMRKYSHRLYEVGKIPVQNKSMNHNCFLSNIQMVEEAVGEHVWSELRESALL